MHLRRFVLAPLAELAPELQVSGRPHGSGIVATCADESAVQRLETA